LNQASTAEALAWLDGIYEHSPWVAEQALAQRPFRSLAHLKWALAHSVMQADPTQQMALIKAHPLLAAKPNPHLTSESKQEQQVAGLWQSTPAQAAQLQAPDQCPRNPNLGWAGRGQQVHFQLRSAQSPERRGADAR
jgi:N-carbamoyl-L-amino-acid hydrolase